MSYLLDSNICIAFFKNHPVVVEKYGEIRAALAKSGRLIGANDLLIAAIATTHPVVLVTHNVREFERVPDLVIEDWLI